MSLQGTSTLFKQHIIWTSYVNFLVFHISAILFAASIDKLLLQSLTLLNPNESQYSKPLSITKQEVKSLVPVQKNYLYGPSPLKFPVIAGLTIQIILEIHPKISQKHIRKLHFWVHMPIYGNLRNSHQLKAHSDQFKLDTQHEHHRQIKEYSFLQRIHSSYQRAQQSLALI